MSRQEKYQYFQKNILTVVTTSKCQFCQQFFFYKQKNHRMLELISSHRSFLLGSLQKEIRSICILYQSPLLPFEPNKWTMRGDNVRLGVTWNMWFWIRCGLVLLKRGGGRNRKKKLRKPDDYSVLGTSNLTVSTTWKSPYVMNHQVMLLQISKKIENC